MAALAKLKPYFDRLAGTVTVGNACPLTDGAAAMLVMRESKAKELGLEPLGYLREYAYAALEGNRMGLGPVYASAKLFAKGGFKLSDFQLIEINEAFAAQVIACERAFASDDFAKQYLQQDHALGVIDRDRLNVNGGAIALGHPVGATGSRLIITMLKELRRRGLQRGLASLCIGGGQGAALALEVA
jgi:acetyl-CoA C-acetyltransferase/acetyl-CoA acyltransferase